MTRKILIVRYLSTDWRSLVNFKELWKGKSNPRYIRIRTADSQRSREMLTMLEEEKKNLRIYSKNVRNDEPRSGTWRVQKATELHAYTISKEQGHIESEQEELEMGKDLAESYFIISLLFTGKLSSTRGWLEMREEGAIQKTNRSGVSSSRTVMIILWYSFDNFWSIRI